MGGVDRLTLVELIEAEAAKLSPRGRELWERLILHTETLAPEEVPPATLATLPPPDREQVELADLMAELSWQEQGILERLMELLAGLRSTDYAETHGQPSEPHRNRAVVLAAGIKDHHLGRWVNPYMTPEGAVARLREPG